MKKSVKKTAKFEPSSRLSEEEEKAILDQLDLEMGKKEEIAGDIINLFKEKVKSELPSSIIKLQEYTVSGKLLTELTKVETDKVKQHGWDNFFSAVAYSIEEKEVKKERILFFVPQSLLTRIRNLELIIGKSMSEFKLYVKFNGEKASTLNKGKTFLSFYSELM